MAKAKKSTRKSTTKGSIDSGGYIISATGMLFAGGSVILIANLLGIESLKLILVGFGAAMLVLGGVILGMAVKPSKR